MESIPQQLNEGILVTLPKPNKDLLEVSNRRPITLLNLDYKLYSKILKNRFKKISITSHLKYQTGFVKGRFIIDNIIALDMILDHLNKCQSEAIMMQFSKLCSSSVFQPHSSIQSKICCRIPMFVFASMIHSQNQLPSRDE